MAASDIKNGLFKEFPPVSTESWEKVIEKDLKGADYSKRLIWRSVDGIVVKPYFRREDIEELDLDDAKPGVFPFLRGTKADANSWLIRQEITFESLDKAVEKAANMIKKGVQSIKFIFDSPVEKEVLSKLLSDLPLKEIEVTIFGLDVSLLPDVLDVLTQEKTYEKADLNIHWDWDPLGEFSLSGKLMDEEGVYGSMAKIIADTSTYPGVKLIGVHGNYFRQAGSKFVQELAFSLALANEYLSEMDDMDHLADETASKMVFNFAIGSNYFLELAKLRAARLLWSRIIESYAGVSIESASMHIHAETSTWNKTVYDPYINILRTTTEAMSAVLGGVDSLTCHPFNSTYKDADEFSERLARNKQIILKEEAHFDKVVDPGGGSYYIEKLTDSIAAQAWSLFQEVEKRGGYTQAFLDGFIQNEIATSAQVRDENIAMRKEVLLGINKFPNTNEKLNTDADPDHIKTPVIDPTEADAHPLIPYRGAEGFEFLRIATERAKKRPRVFLLTIGNLAMRKGRADFAANFFGCAGYEIINNKGFGTVSEGMAVAEKERADIIVLCSSDEEYAEFGPEAAKLNAKKSILVIAGYPKDIMEKLESHGISNFIHVRTNVLESLKKFQKELGIQL